MPVWTFGFVLLFSFRTLLAKISLCSREIRFFFLIQGIDVLHSGIATHYCESARIAELEQALLNLENPDDIHKVLNEFCPKIKAEFTFARHLDQINKCFDAPTIEGILRNLENDDTDWAKQTIQVSKFELLFWISSNKN